MIKLGDTYFHLIEIHRGNGSFTMLAPPFRSFVLELG